MVRWFAEQAGGTARIRSVVGQGTTVTLLLPEVSTRVGDAGDKTMPLSTLPTGTEHIVVLAPDEALYSTIRQILEVLGYTVTFAGGSEELATAMRAAETHLLIVDGAGRDDIDVLQRARTQWPNLRIIVTSDAGFARGRLEPLGAAVLAKPFSLADLAGMVRRTLDAVRTGRP
jgi:DNA-binding NtrC family response regulator